MLLVKLFLIVLALGGVWRMIACAYAGRAAWGFAILYSLFFVSFIVGVWLYLPWLASFSLLLLFLIIIGLLYLPILFCFTRGWQEKSQDRTHINHSIKGKKN